MAKAKNINTITKKSLDQMSDKTVREYFWALIQHTKNLSSEVGNLKKNMLDNRSDLSRLKEQLVIDEVISEDDSLPSDVEVVDDDEIRPGIVGRRRRDDVKKPTIWCVDSENVGNGWTEVLARCVRRGDNIRYLYTSNSPAPPKGLNRLCRDLGVTLGYDACDCGRPNALDFQIVCAMSMCAAQQGHAYRYRVFSNDRGFTMATGYLVRQGYDAKVVSRADF
jgi:hypothetical protein